MGADPLPAGEPLVEQQVTGADAEDRDQIEERSGDGRGDASQAVEVAPERDGVVQHSGAER